MATINVGYKSYGFRNKDPIIDEFRTAFQDEGLSYNDASIRSGVSVGTYVNWFEGETRRPQFASLQATARAIGYDLRLVRVRNVPKIESLKKRKLARRPK